MKSRFWSDIRHSWEINPGHAGPVGPAATAVVFAGGTGETWTGDGTSETHTGTKKDDTLDGAGGDDTIHGGKGNDTITGGTGADTMTGDAGNDIIRVGNGDLSIDGGDGDDTIVLDPAGGTLGVLAGGAGYDTFDASGVTAGYAINDANISGIEHFIGGENNEITGGSALDETYEGRGGNDQLHGNTGNDILLGGEGNDWLWGDKGNDQIKGENGDDNMLGGLGDDKFDGGDGWDHVYYTNSATAVTVDLGAGTATGEGTDTFKNVEAVVGSAFNDHLTGTKTDNYLSGLAGDDTLDGGKGNDWVWYNTTSGNETINLAAGTATGALGNDTLIGIESVGSGSGNDTITGSSAANLLYGFDGNDTLFGGSGDDFLYGGNGFDTITGGRGTDVMYGGAGADQFVFADLAGGNSSPHYIMDLDGSDTIDLRGIDAIPGGGDQAFIVVTQFNGAPGEATIAYNSGTNTTYISLDTDGGASPTANFVIAITGDWHSFGNIMW